MSVLTPPQEPGTKRVLGCKQWHYLGWSGAVGSGGGAAPRHSSAKPTSTGRGLQSPPVSCLTAPCLSFPGSEEPGTQRAFSAQTRHAFTSCSCHSAGGDPTAHFPPPGEEFVGFASPVKLRRSKAVAGPLGGSGFLHHAAKICFCFPTPSCKFVPVSRAFTRSRCESGCS